MARHTHTRGTTSLASTRLRRWPTKQRLPRRLARHLGLVAALGVGLILPLTAAPSEAAGPATTTADNSATVTTPMAYVGLFQDNAVGVIDTSKNQEIATIPVPAGPHGMVLSRDGDELFVSSDGATTVSVIDTASNQVETSIEVGQAPHGLAITPDGHEVLAAVFGASQVAMIDAQTYKVVGQVPVPNPHNIAISPDGATAYVASQASDTPSLAILDVLHQAQIGSVRLDKTPRALNFSPDGTQLYFTEAGVDAVQVLDPASNQIVAQVPVGASPHHPLFTPSGDLSLVVSQGPGELELINPKSEQRGGEVKVGTMPHWIAATPDGQTAYVTDEGSNDVSVVDLAKELVTSVIPVGRAPRKIVMRPGGTATTDVSMPQGTPAGSGGMAMPPAAPPAAPAASAPAPAPPAPAAPAAPAVAPAAPAAPAVKIAGFAFGPASLAVAAGQTITWTNGDSVTHTITSDDKLWDSGPVAPGASFSVTLTQPGTYTYHCSVHPFMRGTVVVTS
jgi:YVTN family beta-propeller protein